MKRSRRRASPYPAGAASSNVSTVVPTAMIVLLITPWTTSGLPTTAFWYGPKSGGQGTSLGGMAKMSRCAFSDVAAIQ